MKVLLLGSGYIGQAFAKELGRRGWEYRNLRRAQYDYTRFDNLVAHLKTAKPEFVINAAGFSGRPNVDECEINRAETIQGNVLLPQTIAHACQLLGIPWGHVSSGCVFNEDSLPSAFTEADVPNFTFRRPPCSFYSGTKAMAEEVIAGYSECYLWRLRIPFDEFDGPRNYLSKLQRYEKVYSATNSIAHRGDFVSACLDLWEKQAPYGIYNLTNPGYVTTKGVVQMILDILKPDRDRMFKFWESDEEFYKFAKAPRSNCVLDTMKAREAGVKMRPVDEAIEHALTNWVKE